MNIHKAKNELRFVKFTPTPNKQLKIQNKIQLDKYKFKSIYKHTLLSPELGDNK